MGISRLLSAVCASLLLYFSPAHADVITGIFTHSFINVQNTGSASTQITVEYSNGTSTTIDGPVATGTSIDLLTPGTSLSVRDIGYAETSGGLFGTSDAGFDLTLQLSQDTGAGFDFSGMRLILEIVGTVSADGIDAFAFFAGNFTANAPLLPAGTNIVSEERISDTVLGNESNGIPIPGFGGSVPINYSTAFTIQNLSGSDPVIDIGFFSGRDGGSALQSTIDYDITTTFTLLAQPVPIPPALWLFGSGLIGLVGIARRRRNTSAPLKQQQQRRRSDNPLRGLFYHHS